MSSSCAAQSKVESNELPLILLNFLLFYHSPTFFVRLLKHFVRNTNLVKKNSAGHLIVCFDCVFVYICVCSSTVQSVLRESQVICESKDKQIAELKKLSDQSTDSLKNEWEKKVSEKAEDFTASSCTVTKFLIL